MNLGRDIVLLVAARVTRLFAYGFLSVILALYLAELGFSAASTGVLLTLALAGDAVVSLWLTASSSASSATTRLGVARTSRTTGSGTPKRT